MRYWMLFTVISALISLTGCERWLTQDCLIENEVENARFVIRVVSVMENNPRRCRARVINVGDETIRIRRIRHGYRGAEITTEIFRLAPREHRRLDESDDPCDGAFYIMNEQGNEIGFWDPREEIRGELRSRYGRR